MATTMLKPDADQIAAWRDRREHRVDLSPTELRADLADRARLARRTAIETISSAGQGHVGGDMSVTDILTVLFECTLEIDPSGRPGPHDDRFVLSKGHCAASLYTALANVGYFSPAELSTFMAPMSALNGHPNCNKVPGVETNTGPLGHGLPFAVGLAKAAKITGSASRTFVVVGDGELQEGSNWEAMMSAAHHGLDNLTVIVDRNTLQQGARTEATNQLEPLAMKVEAFGLDVREVDGHDHLALIEAFEAPTRGRPVFVLARTLKGRGVSFMEDRVEWHHKVPSTEQAATALEELR